MDICNDKKAALGLSSGGDPNLKICITGTLPLTFPSPKSGWDKIDGTIYLILSLDIAASALTSHM